jgi:hypothetical protein
MKKETRLNYGMGKAPLTPFNYKMPISKFDLNLAQWFARAFGSLLACRVLKSWKPSRRKRVQEIIPWKTLFVK